MRKAQITKPLLKGFHGEMRITLITEITIPIPRNIFIKKYNLSRNTVISVIPVILKKMNQIFYNKEYLRSLTTKRDRK